MADLATEQRQREGAEHDPERRRGVRQESRGGLEQSREAILFYPSHVVTALEDTHDGAEPAREKALAHDEQRDGDEVARGRSIEQHGHEPGPHGSPDRSREQEEQGEPGHDHRHQGVKARLTCGRRRAPAMTEEMHERTGIEGLRHPRQRGHIVLEVRSREIPASRR